MGEIEQRLKHKLSEEEHELVLQLLSLPPSRIRSFIEEKAEEATR